MLGATPNQRVAHLLAFIEQPERLEALEAPFDQSARLPFAFLLGLQTVDDEDQTLFATLGACHKPVAGLFDIAGFQPVDSEVGLEDERIAIVEGMLVEGEISLPEEVVVLWKGVDEKPREHSKLARRHYMAVGW